MTNAGEGDVTLKLLHTADWHLGKRFSSFDPEDELSLTRARLDVIENILEVAERNSVDAVLCAGDLFDEPNPDRRWWEGLGNILRSRGRSNRPVFLLPGNHDPLTEESVYARNSGFRRMLPDFVHVVDRDDFSYELKDGATLYAIPCRSRAGEKDLALALPARQPGDERLRIGLVHGQTFDIKGHDTNFPIHRNAAVLRGLDYLAIGDTHSFREVEPSAPVPTIYPGAPEGTSFGEDAPGHVAIVLLFRPGRKAIVRQERVGRWRWQVVTARTVDDVRALRDSGDLRQAVIRLVLDMAVSIPEKHGLEGLLEELKGTEATHGRVGILQVDRTLLRLAPQVQVTDFPVDLPQTLRGTIQRLQQRAASGAGAERDQAILALSHLWKLVQGPA